MVASWVNFLNPEYADVSAVLGCGRSPMRDGLPLVVVQNPLVRVPLPHGLLGADKKYIAEDEGESYSFRRLIG